MALSDVFVKNVRPVKRPSKHSDGGGLHLLVSKTGSKLWRWSYRFDKKQKTLAFGVYPTVTLADARVRRDEAKKQLAKGTDPAKQLKLDRINKRETAATTFNAIADDFLAKVEREGKAEATLSKKKWLLHLARPDIGHRPISEISAAEILVPLRKVEGLGNHETAKRLRAIIGQVFRYAIASAKAVNDPTYGLKGALTAPIVIHRPALTDKKSFGKLLREVWKYEGTPETTTALKLMA